MSATASHSTPPASPATGEEGWQRLLREQQLRTLRLVVGCGCVALFAIVARSYLLFGRAALSDLANAACLAIIFGLIRYRPDWSRMLVWLVPVCTLANIVSALFPLRPPVVQPTLLMLPLLVLYGTFLGELRLSAVLLAVVLGIFGGIWWHHRPLSALETVMMSNLILSAVVAGVASLGVWREHHQMEQALRAQARELQRELDLNLRLNAVIFHDIANPLSTLLMTLHLAKPRGRLEAEDLATAERMGERIAEIIECTRQAVGTSPFVVSMGDCAVDHLYDDLREIFGPRLQEKGQQLALSSGGTLRLHTSRALLTNSILGNLVSNAIKYSPGGSTIELSANRENGVVRLAISDRGPGFPPEIIRRLEVGTTYLSRPGTAGERGTGFGLRIATFYLQRLQGRMEISPRDGGGTTVTVVLPNHPGSAHS